MRTLATHRRRRRSGFSLIEMLIVVMYISIIAAMALPKLTGAARRAGESNLRATLREIRNAVASFQAETGLYPVQLADITVTQAPDSGLTTAGIEVGIMTDDFHGPYLLAPGGGLPVDRTNGRRQWNYCTTPPNVGRVLSLSTGTSLDGEPYATF